MKRQVSATQLARQIFTYLPLALAGLAVSLATTEQPWHLLGNALLAGAGGVGVGSLLLIMRLRWRSRRSS
jgi:hypothetical protein